MLHVYISDDEDPGYNPSHQGTRVWLNQPENYSVGGDIFMLGMENIHIPQLGEDDYDSEADTARYIKCAGGYVAYLLGDASNITKHIIVMDRNGDESTRITITGVDLHGVDVYGNPLYSTSTNLYKGLSVFKSIGATEELMGASISPSGDVFYVIRNTSNNLAVTFDGLNHSTIRPQYDTWLVSYIGGIKAGSAYVKFAYGGE